MCYEVSCVFSFDGAGRHYDGITFIIHVDISNIELLDRNTVKEGSRGEDIAMSFDGN